MMTCARNHREVKYDLAETSTADDRQQPKVFSSCRLCDKTSDYDSSSSSSGPLFVVDSITTSSSAAEKNGDKEEKEKKCYVNQLIAAFAVSFGPFAVGLGKGYPSPAIASMMNISGGDPNSSSIAPLTALEIDSGEASWIASLSLLGALFGGLTSGIVLRRGRKRALALISLPFAASWMLTTFATCVEMMYLTAFLVGAFSAIAQLATQVYISEIAHQSIRASLCSASKFLSHFGFLCSFVLGAFLDFRQLACVCAGAPLTLFITAMYVPETPSYLVYTGQRKRAEDALKWLRDRDEDGDVDAELDIMLENVSRKSSNKRNWRNKRLVKPLLITCGLTFFARFSGIAALNCYAVSVFRETFFRLNPHLVAVIAASVQLAASGISGVLADYFGRVPLLIASTALMAAALAGFGSYQFYAESAVTPAETMDWIPLIFLVLFVGAFSLGVNPISWLLMAEIFPLELRSTGPPLVTAFSYICAFINVKSFVDMREAIGIYGVFWTFSIVSVFGLAFCLAFIPETRGVALEEMADSKRRVKEEEPEV